MKKYLIASAMFVFFSEATAQKKYGMLIGTYTSTTSQGIYSHSFDPATGNSSPLDSVKTSNPSFLAISPDQSVVYAVNEDVNGSMRSFSLDRETGKLSAITALSTEGKHPCYISVDGTGKWLAVGNYSSGNFLLLPAYGNQLADTPTAIIQHVGKSVDAKRQNAPHVHATIFSPDNRYLLVNDLGIDKIMVYRFNERTGAVHFASETAVEAGSGPRHLVFHPNKKYVYLLNELTGRVNVYRYYSKNGALEPLQTISSVPADFTGFAGSADIHVSADGKFLYASNRGDANNIAIYSIDKKAGKLTIAGFQPVLGKAPRNFSIDPSGKYLLCANQDSDAIVVFKRNTKTGLLTDTGKRIHIPKPVCIKWFRKKK